MSRPRPAWTPPPRDGVGASRVAVAAGPWGTVLAFLLARLPVVADWPQRLARGDVLDAAGRAVSARDPVLPGQLLWYWRSLPPEPRVPFELTVLHRDEHLVVVDKPHFLPVAPSGRYLQETVLVRLKRLLGVDSLVALHRLDRETAGVLLFAVRADSRDAYHALWRQRQVHKVYEAVAAWRDDLPLPATVAHRLEEPSGAGFMQMQVVAGEPNAHTRIDVLQRLAGGCAGAGAGEGRPAAQAMPLAWYRLQPLTGRRHQLRAQMNALGLPIVGDRIYPRLWPEPPPDTLPDWSCPLQLLAREIAFTDPLTGQARHFSSRQRLALAG
jgi:tRNA pseudouridine32 synthase/23S rRNA pseudouridine746 synthase